MNCAAVILAGGTGQRFAMETPKQFARLAGRYVIEHTLDCFERHPAIDAIVVVVPPEHRSLMESIVAQAGLRKIRGLISGGRTRRESSAAGIRARPEATRYVLIHDAVRPFLASSVIDAVVAAFDHHGAVDTAIESADTLIEVEADQIAAIPPRSRFRRGQTPQGFRLDLIRKAHELYERTGEPRDATDDCGLVLHHRLAPIHVVPGEQRNLKLTYPEDLVLADAIMRLRTTALERGNRESLRDKVLVVFGHSGGIGKELVARATALGIRAHGFSRSEGCDIGRHDDVRGAIDSVMQREQRVDLVVNAAGKLTYGPLAGIQDDEVADDIATNYVGAINVVRASHAALDAARGMLLLFASSSYTRGRAMYGLYSSSKAAIVNLAQAVAEEWAPTVRVNVLCPARTDTPMRRRAFGIEPAGSLLHPGQVADAALDVLSQPISGQVFDIR